MEHSKKSSATILKENTPPTTGISYLSENAFPINQTINGRFSRSLYVGNKIEYLSILSAMLHLTWHVKPLFTKTQLRRLLRLQTRCEHSGQTKGMRKWVHFFGSCAPIFSAQKFKGKHGKPVSRKFAQTIETFIEICKKKVGKRQA